ncbi:MAG: hypothetical protein KZQ87_07500 [Candidatus Thiodiazotropha sp. (ex Cardiolucina cf. quadrata)]|nr:hypothetical protein [Candidatus Thiodiazotropha sp. (ex Cardiolucina cf. quadrata)]
MNLLALTVGSALAIYVVLRFRATKLEHKSWVYPLLLASFPFYYFAFALFAEDYSALANEIIAGLGFIAIAYAAHKLQSRIGLFLLAAGYIAHAIYDVAHNSMFTNEGTPTWWPEFCGAVDGLIGVYLVFLALSFKESEEYA